jgi:hypothetical protein
MVSFEPVREAGMIALGMLDETSWISKPLRVT